MSTSSLGESGSEKRDTTTPQVVDLPDTKATSDASVAKLEEGAKLDEPEWVEWDGPDDPRNPQNWSSLRRWCIVGLVSAVTFNM